MDIAGTEQAPSDLCAWHLRPWSCNKRKRPILPGLKAGQGNRLPLSSVAAGAVDLLKFERASVYPQRQLASIVPFFATALPRR